MLNMRIEKVMEGNKVIYNRQDEEARHKAFSDYMYKACMRHNVDFSKVKERMNGNGRNDD